MNDSTRASLTVMSFNIRCSTARGDGIHVWPQRAESVGRFLEDTDADLIALQEATAEQVDFLKPLLSDHDFHGVGRDDGARAGEFAAMLFRSRRFDRLDAGHRWLSPTPSKPGPPAWDAGCTRMFSHLRLLDRSSRRSLLWINTHWDHVGVVAREQSARLIRQFIDDLRADSALLITGDFNCTERDQPHRHLIGTGPASLVDAFRSLHPDAPGGTFHNFTGNAGDDRIDWILHDPSLRATRFDIHHTRAGTRWLSDHFPISAILEPRTR